LGHSTKKQSIQKGAVTSFVRKEKVAIDPDCARYKSIASKERSFKTTHASALALAVSTLLKQHGCRRVVARPDKITGRRGCNKIALREALCIYYREKFETLEYLTLMKDIKYSICSFFSLKTGQEAPEGKLKFCIFPHFIMNWVNSKLRLRKRNGKIRTLDINRRMEFLHSILQLKSILAGPKREHIEELYKKHSSIMTKEANKTPQYILDEVEKVGKEFGKIVNQFYKPLSTLPPSQSATFDSKRSEGGQKGLLLNKKTSHDLSSFRVEPTVLFLCGKPGVGKSRLVMSICRTLCRKLNIPIENSIYTRNCMTTHWDGYVGQPITILDDWGQHANSNEDLVEMISLVTDNCYPLPMAHLNEKGSIFTSKFLILCSNIDFSSSNSLSYNASLRTFLNHGALLRRLEIPIRIINARHGSLVNYTDITKGLMRHLEDSTKTVERYVNDVCFPESKFRLGFCDWISEKMIKSQNSKQNFVLSELPELGREYPWRQEMININTSVCLPNGKLHNVNIHRFLEFPGCPPSELPKVRTVAVAKALGSRMVTCAEEDTRCLKPLQLALWKALGRYKQFAPTHGVDLQVCYDSLGPLEEQEFLLSGDYESATDNINMDVSNKLLESILLEIDHEPTRLWAMWENGQHTIHYPSWTNISPVIQTTGQLMGSLLSFPLLCLINDIVVSLAGIKRRIINGDDLLCRATAEQITSWKEISSAAGLTPSIGKNFVSKTFGTFNSQLFVNG
jgi:hypothetical protein